MVPAVLQEDTHLLHIVLSKLQFIQSSKVILSEPFTTSLRVLGGALADTTNGAEILPRTKEKAASNQGTASETAAMMGTQKKGGKKRKILDPYSGGQASGKSAKADARTDKKVRILLSAEEDQPLQNDDFEDLVTPDMLLPPSPALVSPESEKTTALQSVVPPIPAADTPQMHLKIHTATSR
ncbi:hypothetical protein K438DRAFT_1963072 [Mycena galopus ATCC 62051]|nr:hypothetical protein K438DRAFT_1963072 [Mycena galopus ATCC 62051]